MTGTSATDFLNSLAEPDGLKELISRAEQSRAKPGSILDEEMIRLIELRSGMSQKEIQEYNFPPLTPERDVSLKYTHLIRGDVRWFMGRVYTAKDVEEKYERVFGYYARLIRLLKKPIF